jgi:enoyl-CoA hydratase
MEYETLLYEKEHGVITVTLNRPERLNAINGQMMMDLDVMADEIEEDEEARVVILTGAGRAFCAGADIKAMAEPDYEMPHLPRYTFFKKIEDLPIPVIAAINGPCNGGGLEIALCCDFRIAAEEASFGLGEVKLGVIPAGGGTARLPRLIGVGRAKEFLYFGDRVDGKEAERIGLVNKAVPLSELMAEVKRWTAKLVELPPLSVRALKDCVNVGMQMDIMAALDYEAKHSKILMQSEDMQEGMRAFAEKRKPRFKGR